MNHPWLRLLFYFIFFVCCLASYAQAQAPVIGNLNPQTGPVNTYVTINGMSFGTITSSSRVTFNGVNATGIVNWSDTVITVLVPQGAATGAVVVTTGSGSSNSAQFSVTLGIGRLSPAAGPTGASVTVLGSGFGLSQGTVRFNGISAPISNWGDTSIAVQVPSNATSGPVLVNVGGVNSNGVYFTVQPPSGPVTAIGISPAIATIPVGQARNVALRDNNGASITSAQWSVNDNTRLRLSTDNPPVLTALAPGTVTLTATYSGLTANATITIANAPLGFGTVLWSTPVTGGVFQVDDVEDGLPAMYSVNGSNHTLTAFTNDGQQLWTFTDPSITGVNAADNTGGLLTFVGSTSIVRRDSSSGAATWTYDTSAQYFTTYYYTGLGPAGGIQPAIHPDGTIYQQEVQPGVLESDYPNYRSHQYWDILGLNPITGQPRLTIQMPTTHISVNYPGCPPQYTPWTLDTHGVTAFGPLSVGPDGSLYVEVSVRNLVEDFPGGPCTVARDSLTETLSLLTIRPDGSYTSQQLTENSFVYHPPIDPTPQSIFPGYAIPDNNGGVLAFWNYNSTANIWHQGVSFVLPSFEWLDRWITGQNNTVYAIGGTDYGHTNLKLTAFDSNSGVVQWTASAPGVFYGLNMAVEDGLFASSYDQSSGQSQFLKFDPSGNPTPYDIGFVPTFHSPDVWTSYDNNSRLQAVVGPRSCQGVSFWPFVSGNLAGQNAGKPSACITANFGPGPKTPGDNLQFLRADVACSEDVGLFDCANLVAPTWVWNTEIQAKISDEAPKWFVAQTFTGGRAKGIRTNLQPFDLTLPPSEDTPDPPFVQQLTGDKELFWLDSPGLFHTSQDMQIDSLRQVMNFVSKVCSTQPFRLNTPCFKVNWFLKFIVNPGGQLDFTNSQAGIGTASTDF